MEIRELTFKDYHRLMTLDLKEHDTLEAKIVYNIDSKNELRGLILETVVFADEAYGIFINDELIGAYGLTSDDEEVDGELIIFYRPWFFTSERIEEVNKVTIGRVAKETVERWQREYGELYNVAMYSPKMVRWLEWLGFTIDLGRAGVMTFKMKGE